MQPSTTVTPISSSLNLSLESTTAHGPSDVRSLMEYTLNTRSPYTINRLWVDEAFIPILILSAIFVSSNCLFSTILMLWGNDFITFSDSKPKTIIILLMRLKKD